MRHIFALVLFTFSIYAQSIKLGFGLGIVFSNNETNTGGIGSILVENDFQNGLVIRTSGSFLLSEFSANNQELKTDQYYQTQIEIAGIYKPFSWNIEPYFGVGFGYYNPESQQSGNANVINGFPVGIKDIKSGVGTNILIGLDLSPKSKVNFIVEFKRTFFKTNFTFVLNTNEFMENINLYSNTVSLIVRFGIF
ncbi:MAG: hypothetical protein CMF23_07250 [Ignavibacteriae bacterium]|nr:hypothetical protein [Ignavibacteriota bacterium]